MTMTLTLHQKPDHIEADIVGEIDGKTAPEIQNRLLGLAQPNTRLVVDMKGVTFLSSAGLRMLLLVYRHFASLSGEVLLAGVSEEIRDTMSMTGFLAFFTLVDTASGTKRS